MSLQGSLRQLGLADVLQTALAGREGNLILRRGAIRAVLHVATDQLYLIEPDPIDPAVLLDGFVHRGLLAEDTLAAELSREGDALRALDGLLDQGLLPWSEVDAVLRGTAEDAILDLLTWQDGEFRFEEGEPRPDREGIVHRVGVDIGGMLLRAAQRLDEHNVIAEELGLEALLFIPMDAPPPVDYEGDPTPTVHALLDGQRVIDEVAMLCGLTRFSVLRSVFACVRCGAARTPTAEELADQVHARIEADQLKVARGLILQWASRAPTEEEPLLRLADLARRHQSPEEHADALQALGRLRLSQGRAPEAQETFRELLALRPGDETALEALCQAAEAAGDEQQVRQGTIELARSALEADDAEKAAELLEEMTRSPDAPLEGRVLRGRALIRLKLRDQLVIEAEGAAHALGQRARRRNEKEAALFFRDAIATMAPERGDLLRRFRMLVERPKNRRRNVAVVVALLAVVGTAGFLLRPVGAGALLEQVEAAYAAGDVAQATTLVAQLAERYPDAVETDTAFRLQREHTVREANPESSLSAEDREALERAVHGVKNTLPAFPAVETVEALGALHRILGEPAFEKVQRRTLDSLSGDLTSALRKAEADLRARRDVLARAATHARGASDVNTLRVFIPQAETLLKDHFASEVETAETAVSTLVGLHAGERLQNALRALRGGVPLYRQALGQYADDLVVCKRILAEREIEEAYDQCRTQAVKYLTNARLDEAEAYYRTLADRVQRVVEDPELGPIRERVERRHYVEFLEEKLSLIADIREGLANATAAEAAGDIEQAVRIFRTLAETYWLIRLEDIIEMPMEVRTTPSGAEVFLGDRRVGRSPCLVRYPWAKQQTLTIRSPGFATERRLIGTQKVEPRPRLTIALTPRRRWTVPIDENVIRPPVDAGGDLLVVERNGRLTRLSGSDGSVRWARHVQTLEGTRAQPVPMEHQIALVFLDGRVVFYDPDTGSAKGEAKVGRPSGDPVYVGDALLVPTLDGHVTGWRGGRTVFDVEVGDRPTAGLVLAHERAWLGLSNGDVAFVDRTGSIRRTTLPGRTTDVVGLSAHAQGVLATKTDGVLTALRPDGAVAWSQKDLGDLVGAPAVAGDVAAVVDRRGHVLLFRLDDGHPLGQITLGDKTVGGLLATPDGALVALLADGTLWMHDPARGVDCVRVDLGGETRIPPVLVGERALAVPADGRRLTLLELPPRPTE